MARKRVDWDEEIRKTERIRQRGLLMSGFSFALAIALIFGISKFGGEDIIIPKSIIFAVIFCVSFIVFRAVIKYRRRKRNESR